MATRPRSSSPILDSAPLGFQWPTVDPFLFCVHHDDAYPKGNADLGPDASLAGRNIGMDFEPKDGWRMYHGDVVPGFPQHPHRGFETVTLMRRGYIDHSDSLGATARFGHGDVQWMTAGKGIVHCEMFPLVNQEGDNPAELFQIWLNLPAADKMVDPHFTMLWAEKIPTVTFEDDAGNQTRVTVIAGKLGEIAPPAPPPNSWASRPDSDLNIWTITLSPGARWTLPPALETSHRLLYIIRGESLEIAGQMFEPKRVVAVEPDIALEIVNGDQEAEILMLQGRPIGEPVANQGPFVMNTQEELRQAFADYRRTAFGGWPWESPGPVHPREQGRFAKHPDGRREEPGEASAAE